MALHGPLTGVVGHERRSGARARVFADHGAHQRHVRRSSFGRQPVLAGDVVAVEAATGKRAAWHFQFVRHDLAQDYDPPAAPILADITVDGQPIKALVQLGKVSHLRARSRDRRACGRSSSTPCTDVEHPGAAPTQPIPSKPPAFDMQGAIEDNLIDFTPELRAEALEIVKRYTTGPLFTPPSLRDDSPGGNLRHDPATGLHRRTELDRRGRRSRHGHSLRALGDNAIDRGFGARRSGAANPCAA